MNSTWKSAPRDVDLLSWFTGPLVPAVFGGISVVYGVTVTMATTSTTRALILGLVTVAFMAAGFVAVGVFASPRRFDSGVLASVIPILIGWTALLIAIAGEWGSSLPIELRWSPTGFALLLASLSPYVPVSRILLFGILSCIFVVGTTLLSVVGSQNLPSWPLAIYLLFGSGMVVVSTAASTVFAYQVVARTRSWANAPGGSGISSGVLGEAAKRIILRNELASISERALPLLRRVAATSAVTPEDRTEAAALSESLRQELVERSNRSWLDSLARRMKLTVIDRDRRADHMDAAQRAALLGLLTAAAKELGSSARMVIELRGEDGGATAVAVSADQALPEGRKLTMLAPYYVNLVAAADGVEWNAGSRLGLRFRIPQRRSGPTEPTP